MAEHNLGRVAFYDKGAYSESEMYNKWDFVTSDGSTFLFIGETSKIGVPVGDTQNWKCIADARSANIAADNAQAKATLANTAAGNADAKATLAQTAATDAETKIQELETWKNSFPGVTAEVIDNMDYPEI